MEIIKIQLRLLYWSLGLAIDFHKRNVLALLLCTLVFILSAFCVQFIRDRTIALMVLAGPIASAMFSCLEITWDLEKDQRVSKD